MAPLRRSIIPRTNAWQVERTPPTLTANTLLSSSSLMPSAFAAPAIPEEAISPDTSPSSAATRARGGQRRRVPHVCDDADNLRSAASCLAHLRHRSGHARLVGPENATCAPLRANASAHARPMPDVAPQYEPITLSRFAEVVLRRVNPDRLDVP